VRRLFDLDADSKRINAHLAQDRAFASLVKTRPGLRVPGAWDAFELVVRTVLGQQVSVKAATTLASRLVTRFGLDRAVLAKAPLEEIGLPRARASSLRALAASALTFSEPDLEERLVALPGIGPWTASYVALRLGEPDALPSGDLVLKRALGVKNARGVESRLEPLRPWRSYAVLHLWSAQT
jgi:AraC family transcriptional regulator of adaptative response / DNA-3-methyladenine glycosylase II